VKQKLTAATLDNVDYVTLICITKTL